MPFVSLKRYLCLTSSLVAFLTGVNPAWAEKQTDVWVLNYLGRRYGNCTVTVGPAGVLIFLETVGVYASAKPPDWKVVRYNKTAKVKLECSMAEYFKTNHCGGFNKTPSKLTSAKVDNLNATKIAILYRGSVGDMDTLFDSRSERGEDRTAEYDYLFTKDIKAAPQAYQVINHAFKGFDWPGMYLGKTIVFANGQKRVDVALKSAHKARVPLSTFDCPAGYKSVAIEQEVLGGRIHDMEGIMRDLGVGEKFGKD